MRGRFPGPEEAEIPSEASGNALVAEVIRQVRFTPRAVFGHRLEGPPGGIVKHGLVRAAEPVLQAQRQGTVHLTSALLAESLQRPLVGLFHGKAIVIGPCTASTLAL